VEQLGTRRKRLWLAVVRKEVGRAHKSRNYNSREKLTNSKRVATQCMRLVRQKAMQSQRVAKETVWRAKRLTREMQVSRDRI
jgi:DNA helicase INO80